jgi:hypothetical protein
MQEEQESEDVCELDVEGNVGESGRSRTKGTEEMWN